MMAQLPVELGRQCLLDYNGRILSHVMTVSLTDFRLLLASPTNERLVL